jgi:hypothetical protein
VYPVPDPLLLRKFGSAGNRTWTSGSVARNPEAVLYTLKIEFAWLQQMLTMFWFLTPYMLKFFLGNGKLCFEHVPSRRFSVWNYNIVNFILQHTLPLSHNHFPNRYCTWTLIPMCTLHIEFWQGNDMMEWMTTFCTCEIQQELKQYAVQDNVQPTHTA